MPGNVDANEALHALLEECGRERCRLAMEVADLRRKLQVAAECHSGVVDMLQEQSVHLESVGKQNDEMRQLLQVAIVWLPYAQHNARLDGEEAEEVGKLIQRIAALGGRRA